MDERTFEYAIRKDVRNNPIVREVDEQRQRELWQSVGIGVVLVLVLLFSAWQHFELLRHGYRLEQMQRERAAEAEINRHLRLEIETLRAPQRIEKLATERLGHGRARRRRGHRPRAGDRRRRRRPSPWRRADPVEVTPWPTSPIPLAPDAERAACIVRGVRACVLDRRHRGAAASSCR